MTQKFFIFSVFIAIFIHCAKLEAQISSPYNLNFEEGYPNSQIYGWGLGFTAIDSGFTAFTSEKLPFDGEYSAKITNSKKIKLENSAASFFQKIDASFYSKRTVKFTAYVKVFEAENSVLSTSQHNYNLYDITKLKPPHLFIIARNRKGDVLNSAQSANIVHQGWNKYQIEANIPAESTEIMYGITFYDTNDVFIDNCFFEIISDDSLHYESAKPLSYSELMYILPFANICGGLQYFHPSKVASEANWENVILAGIAQSKKISSKIQEINQEKSNNNINNSNENNEINLKINSIIKDSLQAFFSQLAPPIIISNNPISNDSIQNKTTEKHKYLLAWQHSGVPTNVKPQKLSESKIVDLYGTLKTNEAVAVQYIRFKDAQNKELEVTVSAKLQKFYKNAEASISVRFETEMGEIISFLKNDDIKSESWKKYSLKGKVPENATSGLIILAFKGYGRAFFDDVKINYKDKKSTKNISVNNSGFEYTLDFDNSNWMTTNETYSSGYSMDYSQMEKNSGKQSLVLHTDSLATPVFAPENENYFSYSTNNFLQNENINGENNFPKISDLSKVKANEIFVGFPIYVPANFFETKKLDSAGNEQLIVNYETYPISSGFKYSHSKNKDFMISCKDRDSRFAILIKIYNLLKHFSLTEINSKDLDSFFIISLRSAAICEDKLEFKNIIQNFLTVANDNRARVWFSDDNSYFYSLPFNIEIIDNRLYINKLSENNLNKNITVGDEIIGIDGKKIDVFFDKILTNNVPKWEKIKQINSYKYGKKNSETKIEIKHKNGIIEEIDFLREAKTGMPASRAINYSEVINDSILYLDLTFYNDKDIDKTFDTLSHYKKIILDLRGETRTSELFLSLIYNNFFQTSQTCIPYFTKPEKKLMSFYKIQATYYPAETKRFEGKFVFLIDWKTYGFGELFAATVKEYGIGTLIGEETQGALTVGIPIRLDADFSLSLGNMYSFFPTGKPLLNSPVIPDIKVTVTPENLDTDFILQKAIDFLEK